MDTATRYSRTPAQARVATVAPRLRSRKQMHRFEDPVRLAYDGPTSRLRGELNPQVKRTLAVCEINACECVRQRHPFDRSGKVRRAQLDRKSSPRVTRELGISLQHHQEDIVAVHPWDRIDRAVVAIGARQLEAGGVQDW